MSYFIEDENASVRCSRGDIHYIDDMGHINEFGYRAGRPCIIISDDSANQYSSHVTVIPLTSQERKQSPVHVRSNAKCRQPPFAKTSRRYPEKKSAIIFEPVQRMRWRKSTQVFAVRWVFLCREHRRQLAILRMSRWMQQIPKSLN